jgi:formylglycine-generating enzyme required for sulfatase activity
MLAMTSSTWTRTAGALAVTGLAIVSAGARQSAPAAARYHESIPGTLVTFEMVPVPAGPARLPGAAAPVDVAAFAIGRTEVTWDLYDVYVLGLDRPPAVTGSGADALARPSNPYGAPDHGWGHAGFPAMSMTRAAAEAFCAWLSERTGKTYRLPSEAEWQRAADLAAPAPLSDARRRALAWYQANAGSRVHEVATRQPDALGLYDLFGNVGEWVVAAGGALVLRGGTYRDPAAAVGREARAVQDQTWNQTDPQLPKSRWWLSDGPFAGFRVVSTVQGVRP